MTDEVIHDAEPDTDAIENKRLEDELASLLNRHSAENGSDTPDFILATYMLDCLRAWNSATQRREAWYGRGLEAKPGTHTRTDR